MDRTVPLAAARLLDFVRVTEVGTDGPSGYNVIYGFNQDKLPKPITQMTADELIGAQAMFPRLYGSSASGGYQFMRATLKDLKRELGLRGTQIMDPDLQDRLAYHLLKRRGYDQFMAGKIGLTEFAKRLAMEWASFPVLESTQGAHRRITRGQSFYAGDGVNKALVSPEEMERVIEEARALSDAMPAPADVPEAKPEPQPTEPAMPEQKPSKPLTPVQQSNKAVAAGTWAALASAIWTAVVAADVLPVQFTTPEFQAAIGGLIAAAAGAIGAYRAPDKRFTAE